MTVLDKMFETLATLRKTSVEDIKKELKAEIKEHGENGPTFNQLFQLACAFEAVK
jgi:hypothetical protein